MKILCLTPWYPNDQDAKEGNFVLDSVESLRKIGHTVEVLVTRPYRPWSKGTIDEYNILNSRVNAPKVIHHPSIPRNQLRLLSNWLYDLFVTSRLKDMALSIGADVMHIHTELPALTAVPVASKLRIPSVVTLHGYNPAPRLNTPLQHSLLRSALATANRVVLVGEPLRQFFSPIIGRTDHFRVVPNGFRLPLVDLKKNLRSDKRLRLISVSNLHEGKGIELNLKALAILKSQGIRNWDYTVVGDGYLRSELEKLTSELGLCSEVRFVGALGHSDVYRQLQLADVFVLPSYREAFGIAYLEAMAFGLLTVGVRDQGPSAFIEDGYTGILVNPCDVFDLAERLSDIFARSDEMLEIGKRGRQRVLNAFTWESHALQMSKVFEDVIKERQ
jgi:glycosyltransferase involved in cell wall biosynthesis